MQGESQVPVVKRRAAVNMSPCDSPPPSGCKKCNICSIFLTRIPIHKAQLQPKQTIKPNAIKLDQCF
ncbi:UNVERIFIED_CONTAM: hypothetical protein FKN15_008737 [Acipenser sinensis]